jgi:hypothetical protein
LRRSLPPTNPYQEHKNKRLVREIGLTGRSTMEEKTLEREGECLPRRGGPNPHLESSFPLRRTQIATRGRPGTERPSREREPDWKTV